MAKRVHPPSRRPFTTVDVLISTWYRVHPFNLSTGKYAPDVYNDSWRGNARFSPLRRPDTGAVIPTLYASNTERGAIMETVLHDVPVPSSGYQHDIERDRASDLHLSAIRLPELKLLNLTSTSLRAAGLSHSDLFDGDKLDYPRTREWAQWFWEEYPDVQGLMWMSKQDNRSTAVMLFGDRISRPIVDLKASAHISNHEDLLIELLMEMGATVTPVA